MASVLQSLRRAIDTRDLEALSNLNRRWVENAHRAGVVSAST
jgi:hypothetical protein